MGSTKADSACHSVCSSISIYSPKSDKVMRPYFCGSWLGKKKSDFLMQTVVVIAVFKRCYVSAAVAEFIFVLLANLLRLARSRYAKKG